MSIAIAKAGHLPTINMTGGLGTSNNSLSNKSYGNQVKTNFDASAGVSLSIPILDQRQTKTNISKARIQKEQALLDLQDRQKQLYQTIEGYWLDANTNQQKFRAAKTTVESEQQSYNLLSEQFRLGLKNIVELMTGKDRLLASLQSQLQSKYMTILNLQMLDFYSGTLKINTLND
jgi:outer membrane protein